MHQAVMQASPETSAMNGVLKPHPNILKAFVEGVSEGNVVFK
jgi:hypothetical protein